MKTFFIWLFAGLCVCTNLSAQRGGGGGGRSGGGGDFGGGSRNAGAQLPTVSRNYNQVQVSDFPDISGVDAKKKSKLVSIVKNERKNLLKLADQKQVLQIMNARSKNQKEIIKNANSIIKLDDKMRKESLNADKKIQSALTNDQYKEFTEKKGQIKYNDPPVEGRSQAQAPGNMRGASGRGQ